MVLGVGLLAATGTGAQDRPTELPPLLKPPSADPTPGPPVGPRGPTGEYDHGHLYLPDYVPPARPAAPEVCRPLGTWWVNPSLELAWIPTRPAPGAVRLRVPDGAGGTAPGPVVPLGGVAPISFRGGFGLALGRWLGEAQTHGIDAGLFSLGDPARTVTGFAPGMLVLFPGGAGRSAPQVVVFPPGTPVTGVFPATLSTWFIGADVNYRRTLYCDGSARLDALAGYRFAFVRDELFLGEVPDPARDEYEQNRVAAANPFHGGQVGLAGEYRAGDWYVGGAAKVAFGVVRADVTATGLFVGAEGITPAGGFARLAALSGSGQIRFAVLPAVSVVVGRQVREHTRLFAGYSFQYLTGVTRLGDVLDSLGGSPAATADFWVQSVNFGMELRY